MAALPRLLLNPFTAEDLYQQYLSILTSVSGGILSGITPGSPEAALGEGTVFAASELMWALNQLPPATALEVFRIAGVERSPGTKAKGELTFVLSESRVTTFTLPVGYVIPFDVAGSSQNSGYKLTEALVIPAGSLSGKAAIEATDVGTAFNLAAFALSKTNTGIPGLSNIINEAAITSGTAAEPLADTIARASAAIRERDVLVSATDYSEAAQIFLGTGSKAWTIPLLSADKDTELPGNIHVFCLERDRGIPSETTLLSLGSSLLARTFAGAKVWVSAANLQNVVFDITLITDSVDSSVADTIYNRLDEYFSQSQYELGQAIDTKLMEFNLWQLPEVIAVQQTIVDGLVEAFHPLDNKYTLPIPHQVNIRLNDASGNEALHYRGPFTGDPI